MASTSFRTSSPSPCCSSPASVQRMPAARVATAPHVAVSSSVSMPCGAGSSSESQASSPGPASLQYLQEKVELEELNGSRTLKDLTSHVEENHRMSATQCWMTSALKRW